MHNIDDADIHKGHRSRMRQKLLRHGPEIFDTYELLEMLLYHSIPYKDTNPVAKRLLHRFGGLDGVLCASREELTEVTDVGDRTATFISAVDNVCSVIGAEHIPDSAVWFGNYAKTAGYLVSYFKRNPECRFVIATLDNSMHLLELIPNNGASFSSAATKPKLFVDAALRSNCSVVITAQNNYYGTVQVNSFERETVKMISQTLRGIRVSYAEHYVISGDSYNGILHKDPRVFEQSPELSGFFSNTMEMPSILSDCVYVTDYSDVVHASLAWLLSFAKRCDEPQERAKEIISKYLLVENAMSADVDELARVVGRDAAVLIKICAAVASRRITDKFTFGEKHTDEQVLEYFKAIFIGLPVERVYAMLLDKQGRALSCELVGVGTVNSSDIWPRIIIEAARKQKATSIYIAHNHPRGKPKPSQEDVNQTMMLCSMLMDVGITLKAHFIIAGQRHMMLRSGADAVLFE